MTALVEDVRKGSRRALARLLTMVENEREGVESALADLFIHTGNAWVIGITGAPGTGKSSLVNALAQAYRRAGKTVAIIAVDPTSPFSGGAILGDRIRMRDLSGDSGVFIRSMATRGSLGGLSRAVRDGIRVMDAAGFDVILVETVGAGQSEVDIVRTAQTTLVVEAPGLGDDVQAIKAGILEIADVLVVNKSDRPGASNTVRSLKTMLDLGHPASRMQLAARYGHITQTNGAQGNGHGDDATMWMPLLVETVATASHTESNIDGLVNAIVAHRDYLYESGMAAQLERQRIQIELHDRLQDALIARLMETVPQDVFDAVISRVQQRKIDPHAAVQQVLAAFSA
jgi:LAO/AO transport system kinase